MAFTDSEKREMETFIRREIKDFLGHNTIKQFEEKMMEKILTDLKRGKMEDEVKEITLKMFREFYQFMWTNRSYWESRLKNA